MCAYMYRMYRYNLIYCILLQVFLNNTTAIVVVKDEPYTLRLFDTTGQCVLYYYLLLESNNIGF